MENRLIMLPQPILVSDEEIKEGDWCINTHRLNEYQSIMLPDRLIGKADYSAKFLIASKWKKIIAGIEGLPKLDLSLIAEEIGWVDVERLAVSAFQKRFNREPIIMGSAEADSFWLNTWIDSFKAAQSLNEKKYSEEDLIEFAKFCLDYDALLSLTNLANQWSIDSQKAIKLWLQKRKPKEYQVEVEMEDVGGYRQDSMNGCWISKWQPKITNNTIKVTEIL